MLRIVGIKFFSIIQYCETKDTSTKELNVRTNFYCDFSKGLGAFCAVFSFGASLIQYCPHAWFELFLQRSRKKKKERGVGRERQSVCPGHTVSTGVSRGFADKRGARFVRQEPVWCKKGLPMYACSQPREGDGLEWRRRRTAISVRNVRTWVQIAIVSDTTLQIRVRPPRIPVYLHLHPLRQVLLPAGSSQAAYPQHTRGLRR